MRHKNPLRELLEAGKPSLGTRLHTSWPSIIELVGNSGAFDYVEITAEYSPYDLFSLENQGRAIELFDHLSGMIKIGQEMRMHLAVRAMSSGIQNLLFADIRSVADAEECVRAVRAEAPGLGGLHGVGQGRDVGIVLEVGSPAFVQSTADAVVVLMIEKKQAIEDLPAILSVKGVDMVQFGPADYAMSIGLAGDRLNPAVLEVERYMIETAFRMGVTPRVEIRQSQAAEKYLELGVRHFCLGTDVRILFDWYKGQGSQMRELLEKEILK
jgi:4-hydroxy-2-oxoheptanedioate aldolase